LTPYMNVCILQAALWHLIFLELSVASAFAPELVALRAERAHVLQGSNSPSPCGVREFSMLRTT
jgi:hypothetical protein